MSVSCNHIQQDGGRATSSITPKRIIITQSLVIVVTTLIAFFYGGKSAALSVAFGGSAVLLPNAIFATVFLYRSRARSGSSILAIFYLGEIVKLLLTASLAVFFLSIFALSLTPLLVGVVLVSISLVLAPLVPMASVR